MAKTKGMMNHEATYVFLNDGETFTNLSGCTLVAKNEKGEWIAWDLYSMLDNLTPQRGVKLSSFQTEVTDKMLIEIGEDFAD